MEQNIKKGGKITAIILGVLSLPLFGIVAYTVISGGIFLDFAHVANAVILLIPAVGCAILAYRRWMQSNLSNGSIRKKRKLTFIRFIKVLFASFFICLFIINVIGFVAYFIFSPDLDKLILLVAKNLNKIFFGFFLFPIVLFPLVNKYLE